MQTTDLGLALLPSFDAHIQEGMAGLTAHGTFETFQQHLGASLPATVKANAIPVKQAGFAEILQCICPLCSAALQKNLPVKDI